MVLHSLRFDSFYFRKLEMIEIRINGAELGFGDVEVVAKIEAMKAMVFFALAGAVSNNIRENKLRDPLHRQTDIITQKDC